MSASSDVTFGYDPIRGGFSFRIGGIEGGRPVPNEPTRERVPCRQLTRIDIPRTLLNPDAPLCHLLVETVDYHN